MKWPLALVLFLPSFALRAEDIRVPGGIVALQFTKEAPPALHTLAAQWINTAATAVATYYDTFPVPRVVMRLSPIAGDQPKNGTTYGWNGPLITISLGRDSTVARLSDDWLLTHEMLHLAFPSVPDENHWLEEGLATYIEPIARARAGRLTPERAWGDLVDGLPQGQPKRGDRGLDHTHTWGRTYWGGALFCFRADVEIRRRTHNGKGLEHALRAIHAAGGVVTEDWSMDRVISIGDHATGVPVLRELYDQMKATPVTVDLPALYQELGIRRRGHTITFAETAPLADVRKAITSAK